MLQYVAAVFNMICHPQDIFVVLVGHGFIRTPTCSSSFLRSRSGTLTHGPRYRAIQRFLSWCERAGYQQLEDIEPITAAAYIETLQRLAAPPTVKQHMAAIRMLFSWLTEKGVLAMNPGREVKTERFSRTEGKTPAFVDGEVQKLLDAVDASTHTGLRDRALLGVLAYTFARIGAVVNLKVEDYYPSGKRFLLRRLNSNKGT